MKPTLAIDGRSYRARPFETVVIVSALNHCPRCLRPAPEGLHARGGPRRIESRDTYAADARAVPCGCPLGVIRVKMETIFGLAEDELVLGGPWRVY